MKKLIVTLAALLAMGCATMSKYDMRTDSPCGDECRKAKMTVSAEKQDGKKTVIGSDDAAKIIVTNTKTGQAWKFSAEEYKLILESWGNWRTVTGADPEITAFTEDKKSYYITFNYYRREDDDRTKTSVLAGRIVIDKSKFDPSNACKVSKGLNWGLGTYGALMTILVIILVLL